LTGEDFKKVFAGDDFPNNAFLLALA
jgi:hypothetical protein